MLNFSLNKLLVQIQLRMTTYLSASFDWAFNAPRGCWACCTMCLQPELLDSTESLWLLPESLPGPPWCPAAAAPPLLLVKLRRTSVGELSLDVVSGALLSTLAIPTNKYINTTRFSVFLLFLSLLCFSFLSFFCCPSPALFTYFHLYLCIRLNNLLISLSHHHFTHCNCNTVIWIIYFIFPSFFNFL